MLISRCKAEKIKHGSVLVTKGGENDNDGTEATTKHKSAVEFVKSKENSLLIVL